MYFSVLTYFSVLKTHGLTLPFLPGSALFLLLRLSIINKWVTCVKIKSVVREESKFGAAAGEVCCLLWLIFCILLKYLSLVCILYYIIQLPGCQDTFITVNYSQVISLRGKPDTSLGGSDYIYCIIFHFIKQYKIQKYFFGWNLSVLWFTLDCQLS